MTILSLVRMSFPCLRWEPLSQLSQLIQSTSRGIWSSWVLLDKTRKWLVGITRILVLAHGSQEQMLRLRDNLLNPWRREQWLSSLTQSSLPRASSIWMHSEAFLKKCWQASEWLEAWWNLVRPLQTPASCVQLTTKQNIEVLTKSTTASLLVLRRTRVSRECFWVWTKPRGCIVSKLLPIQTNKRKQWNL